MTEGSADANVTDDSQLGTTEAKLGTDAEDFVQHSSAIEVTGDPRGAVEVSIGPKFLQLFSEQLYSSPNKAFEELVANAWDAGASAVYIGMPDDLSAGDAAVWVLDNGESMDFDGLRQLWSVAHSVKPSKKTGRPQIGKFGIGKLSTFLLAHQLTYICKAADGEVRAVTMDYRRIDGVGGEELHINPLPLTVRAISQQQMADLIADLNDKNSILEIIADGVPQKKDDTPDEFGPGDGGTQMATSGDTWTLAVLTDLKPAGQAMEVGRIRRMLRTALPLGNTIAIAFQGEPLPSTKLDVPIAKQWTIGDALLGIEQVEIKDDGGTTATFSVRVGDTPYPHVLIDGVKGRITGTIKLYEEPISGGKSSKVAQSNGFFVNILGRVINPEEPYFGLSNLNHSAWAKVRVAVRADGLNDSVSVDRESVNEDRSVKIFRAFLRAIFNRARNEHDAAAAASWPDAGEVLTKKWGTVPLGPLRRMLGDPEAKSDEVPSFFYVQPGAEWPLETAAEPTTDIVEDVLIEGLGPDSWLVRYDPRSRQVLVNRDHPFAREYAETHEQQILLRDAAVVELLTQAYMTDIGLPDDTIRQVSEYRDQLLRLVARVRRRTAIQLAELLDTVTNDKDALERAVAESLEYLGFLVEFIAGSGEPEGVASAPVTPGERGSKRTYTFTFDAKSSKSGRVANGDVRVSGLLRHKRKYSADHVLVVAPDYEEGALFLECRTHAVTPMRAVDLSSLLLLQGTHGPIPFDVLRELFAHRHPNEVHDWVGSLPSRLNQTPRLSIDDFFAALVAIGYQEPDVLTTAVVAREIRTRTGHQSFPSTADVSKLINGLAVLIPDLLRATGSQIFLGAEPAVIRDTVVRLLSSVPDRIKFVAPRAN